MAMSMLSFLLLITIISIALLIPTSNALNYVEAHNQTRSAVGLGPVTWDPKLARYAQAYANKRARDCDMIHSTGPYGENLAAGSGPFMTGEFAVKIWSDEKANYNYTSNSCAKGQMCGHYTQIVWRDSVRIGCARKKCIDGWYFVICSYDPPGNVIGQRPF